MAGACGLPPARSPARSSTSTPTGHRTGRAADMVLITHDHFDHFSPEDIKRLAGERTHVIGPATVTEQITGPAVSIAPGETVEVDGIDVTAVAAYNTNKVDSEGKTVPSTRRRLGRLRPACRRTAGLPFGRYGRDSRDGPGRWRRHRPPSRQRHVRDDRRRGGRGGPPDRAEAGGADALGHGDRLARGRARSSSAPPRSRSRSSIMRAIPLEWTFRRWAMATRTRNGMQRSLRRMAQADPELVGATARAGAPRCGRAHQ